ncbi:MAG: polysaccharide deacetylase family protein [Pseudomonadales bacterium]
MTIRRIALRGLPRLVLLALLACGLAGCERPEEPAARGGPGSDRGAGSDRAPGSDRAVVLLYHHVATDTPASTSISPAKFAAHLQYLSDHGYQVVPLSRLIDALVQRQPLPDRAVAITFDDAYRSVFTHAHPELQRRGMPYAVFVSTDYLDQGSSHYMSWEQLRALEAAGAEIGNHSRSHAHYLHRPAAESTRAWRQRIADDIRGAQARLQAEIERPLAALAYPYGEFDPALQAIAADLGMVGFGQQSGPLGPASDLQGLPRYPMAGSYAGLDDLAQKLRTRPFDVRVLKGDQPVLTPDAAAPRLRLQLEAPGARLEALSCFVSGQEPPELVWVDPSRGVLEITAQRPLPVGRSKYTCTAPAHDDGSAFYWYSHLWMKPPAAGEWYRD